MEPQIQRWSAARKVELLLSLIKGERKLVDVCRGHDLKQSEVESWMETLKAECVWQHRLQGRDDAFAAIANWMDRYHAERPHSALGNLAPTEYREKLAA